MTIEIIRKSSRWPPLARKIRSALHQTHTFLPPALAAPAAPICIVLATDALVQDLNARFRGQNKPTNVLSFPIGEPQDGGDIILAYETLVQEAQTQQKLFEHHVLHMTIHGYLHLAGYDHATRGQAKIMENLEIKILQKLGINNPYEI